VQRDFDNRQRGAAQTQNVQRARSSGGGFRSGGGSRSGGGRRR
jgi:uncharacterized membrane protein YgcG